MKKGDTVTVNDYSWATHINGRTRNCERRYTVIETGCVFPLQDGQRDCFRSDTVIQIVGSDEIVFIYKNFLRPVLPKHKVMVDIRQDGGWMYGQIVEVSDELYKEIKRS